MLRPIRIGEFLHRRKDLIEVNAGEEYSLVTVKLHHKGVVLRERKLGALLGSNMFRIGKGQFILSGIDARNGAFGVVPDELDGAVITNDFWCFDVDESIVKRDFFYWLSTTPLFLEACEKSSIGETGRVRLQRELFLDFEFHFPPLVEQDEFLRRIGIIDGELSSLHNELENQAEYCMRLRQSILQEGIEGKLTAEWRKKHPYEKGDPERDGAALLESIKAEKARLVSAGKIRKEKAVAAIKAGEEPFALPEGWVWCRLGEVFGFENGDRSKNYPVKADFVRIGIPFFNSERLHDGIIETNCPETPQISETKFNSLRGGKLQNGDLLIVLRGSMVGKSGIFRATKDIKTGFINAQLVIIRQRLLNSDFYCQFLTSPHFQKQLASRVTGTAQPQVSAGEVKQCITPLPPLAEQAAIVARVESLLAKVDELEAEVAARKEMAEELMREVLREAFSGGNGKDTCSGQ